MCGKHGPEALYVESVCLVWSGGGYTEVLITHTAFLYFL